MKKILFIVTGVVLALSLLFAGCGGEAKDPATKIDDAYKKSQDYKTVHAEFDVQLEVSGDLSTVDPTLADMLPINLGFIGNADVDNSDEGNPKVKGTITMEGLDQLIEEAMAASGEAGEAIGAVDISELFSNLEIVLVDNVLYIKVAGSWYEMDVGDLTSGATTDVEDVDTECIQRVSEEKIVPSAMLTDIQDLGSEEIDGKDTSHFKAGLDLDKAVEVTTEVARECGQEEAAGGLEGAQAQLNSMFKTLEVELWIDDDDNMRKLMIDIEMDTAALAELGGTSTVAADELEALESMKIAMTATVNMSRFDEDVEITKPEGALPFEDLLGGFGGLGLDGTSGLEDLEGLDGTGTTGTGPTSTTSSTSTNPFSM